MVHVKGESGKMADKVSNMFGKVSNVGENSKAEIEMEKTAPRHGCLEFPVNKLGKTG